MQTCTACVACLRSSRHVAATATGYTSAPPAHVLGQLVIEVQACSARALAPALVTGVHTVCCHLPKKPAQAPLLSAEAKEQKRLPAPLPTPALTPVRRTSSTARARSRPRPTRRRPSSSSPRGTTSPYWGCTKPGRTPSSPTRGATRTSCSPAALSAPRMCASSCSPSWTATSWTWCPRGATMTKSARWGAEHVAGQQVAALRGRLLQAGWVLVARLLLLVAGRGCVDPHKVQHAIPSSTLRVVECLDGTACRGRCSARAEGLSCLCTLSICSVFAAASLLPLRLLVTCATVKAASCSTNCWTTRSLRGHEEGMVLPCSP